MKDRPWLRCAKRSHQSISTHHDKVYALVAPSIHPYIASYKPVLFVLAY